MPSALPSKTKHIRETFQVHSSLRKAKRRTQKICKINPFSGVDCDPIVFNRRDALRHEIQQWDMLRRYTNVSHDPTFCAEPEVLLGLKRKCHTNPSQTRKLSILALSTEMVEGMSKSRDSFSKSVQGSPVLREDAEMVSILVMHIDNE
jgi:hypothetical protein